MMTTRITRKHFGALALAALAPLALSTAWAQGGYPSRTVTFVVPAAAGGTTDISARMAAQALAPVLGQSVVVDNKGAATAPSRPTSSSAPSPMATRCSCSTRATT